MGFWDTSGEVFLKVKEKGKEWNQEAETKKKQYERYSDEQLIRSFKNYQPSMNDRVALI